MELCFLIGTGNHKDSAATLTGIVKRRMLILTRKPGESVYIGDDVKITLMEIKGNQVRVGIDAPSSVRIYREEIYLQILEENKSAAALSADAPADLKGVASAWENQKTKALDNLEVVKRKAAAKKAEDND